MAIEYHFQIPLANSLRWVNQNPVINPEYNTQSFDDFTDPYNYFHKRQTNGKEPIQLISDFVPTLEFFTCDDVLYLNVPINAVPTLIKDVSFLIYEAEVDYSLFAPDEIYYGKITYVDENAVTQDWRTTPIDVQVKHANTLLYQYKNSYNDKGIVFDTGIIFNNRIEGNLREYQPKSDRQQYEDQEYNGMLLNGIPYRNFNNYIGIAEGIPDWLIDKVNIIFTFDQVQIDGTYYIATNGTEFKPTRPTNQERQDGFWSLEVQSVPNFFLDKFITGETPSGDYVVIKKALTYDNVGASFAVAGVFKENINLIRLAVYNYALDTFTMLIGETLGGDEIGTFEFEGELTDSLDCGHLFNGVATVYITVPTGVNLKVIFDYNQYDAKPVGPTTPVPAFPKGYQGMYYEVDPGDFDIHWNSATGLGRVGTGYEGCAIVNTNGIEDMSGQAMIAWDISLPDERNEVVGAANNEITLTRSVLPNESIFLFSGEVNSTPGDIVDATSYVSRSRGAGSQALNYEMERAATVATRGKSEPLGLGNPLDITPYARKTVMFVKLTD